MARSERQPKSRVLSFRVSDAEWQQLQKASSQSGCDLSSLLRQNLQLLLKAGSSKQ